ncbi:DUF2092 domain-containing protein [Flavobacterium sp. AG291]|uniref:DUF2092 domain-containing protein n=1 Tax=Flavobacterium sp. AG291 TaxID=2184000 RepID=UPI000E0B51D1|nr:DUF2092 domain-containing protein [Flavobacterium sp. AG291]RDI04450.1 hypothetical protein DEU42_12232 [Flavobacterium sp. AG291]
MRKTLLLFSVLISFASYSQAAKVDSVAVLILDRMSDVIGGLNSCSFKLNVSQDVTGDIGLEKKFSDDEVMFKGPDKMLVQLKGDDNHKGFWYNGRHLVYYSYTENNYSVLEVPSTIIETIDAVHDEYGVDFPASDFFYPTFADDILADFTSVTFLGRKTVDGEDCYHILADSKNQSVQLWISDDAMNLPLRFLVIYKDKPNSPQYMGVFSDWKINPDLPDALFDFNEPPLATEIVMLKKSNQ